jgi:hypothetical protein
MKGFLKYWNPPKRSVDTVGRSVSVSEARKVGTSPTFDQTPRNKVLRGIKPCGTTFKNEYFCEFEKEFKNVLGCEFGDYIGLIRGKNQR